jgi:hypothetical protein
MKILLPKQLMENGRRELSQVEKSGKEVKKKEEIMVRS